MGATGTSCNEILKQLTNFIGPKLATELKFIYSVAHQQFTSTTGSCTFRTGPGNQINNVSSVYDNVIMIFSLNSLLSA